MAHADRARGKTVEERGAHFAVVFAVVFLVTASWLLLYGGPLPIFGMLVGSSS